MTKTMIDELDRFPYNTYAEAALSNWIDGRFLREQDDADKDEICRCYIMSCSDFIKHIFEHSKGLLELMANVDFIKSVFHNMSTIEARQQSDNHTMHTLLNFCLEDSKEPTESEKGQLNRVYDLIMSGHPYDTEVHGEFFNKANGEFFDNADNMLHHLYLKAKEVDRKWYA